MMSDQAGRAGQLLWKFVASEDPRGSIWWRWEVWTQAGHYVTSSERQYQSMLECESNARSNGYVEPEKRRV